MNLSKSKEDQDSEEYFLNFQEENFLKDLEIYKINEIEKNRKGKEKKIKEVLGCSPPTPFH
jgi:hypothetical protein